MPAVCRETYAPWAVAMLPTTDRGQHIASADCTLPSSRDRCHNLQAVCPENGTFDAHQKLSEVMLSSPVLRPRLISHAYRRFLRRSKSRSITKQFAKWRYVDCVEGPWGWLGVGEGLTRYRRHTEHRAGQGDPCCLAYAFRAREGRIFVALGRCVVRPAHFLTEP